MTPLESTIALCELGLMVCAAFLLFYALKWALTAWKGRKVNL